MSNVNPTDPPNGNGTPPPVYESPDTERPASATPTEQVLEDRTAAHDPYAALRISEFRLFAGAFFLSVIGGQMQTVAVGWEIYQRTGSTLNLGWMGLALALPTLVLALPAGHVADTHSRRRIMMLTHILALFCALGLAYLSYFTPGWKYSLALLYALLALGAVGATFGRPARQALMPQLVAPRVWQCRRLEQHDLRDRLHARPGARRVHLRPAASR